jgi:hypothetical protein
MRSSCVAVVALCVLALTGVANAQQRGGYQARSFSSSMRGTSTSGQSGARAGNVLGRPATTTMASPANARGTGGRNAAVTVAARTAIARTRAAAPIRVLLDRGLVRGDVLHHGRGRDTHGSEAMREVARSVTDYDPNHAPNPSALERKYDTVVSNFVLNVLPPTERRLAIADIARTTRSNGNAYISVRAAGDANIRGARAYDGVRTSIGTFQRGYTVAALRRELAPYFRNVEVIAGRDNATSITVHASEPIERR